MDEIVANQSAVSRESVQSHCAVSGLIIINLYLTVCVGRTQCKPCHCQRCRSVSSLKTHLEK